MINSPQFSVSRFRQKEIEEKKNYRKDLFRLQVKIILEGMAPRGRASFRQFEAQFLKRTEQRFEDAVDSLRREYPYDNWSLDWIFSTVDMLKYTCHIDYDENDEIVFIFLPKSPNGCPPQLPTNTKQMIKIKKVEIQETSEGTSTGNRSDRKIEQINFWTDVQEMFSVPHWPGYTQQFRDENLKLYKNLIEMAAQKLSKDCVVQREAKRLAIKWWKDRLTFFSHTLFLLARLSLAKPNGFNCLKIGDEISKIYPPNWIEMCPNTHRTIDDFLINSADLIEMNLIMRCDRDKKYMYKVNKVIDLLGFYEIRQSELSMIYQFVESTPQAKTIHEIHTFLCDGFPGWRKQHTYETGLERIWEICTNKPKMFSCDRSRILAKDHAYKIPLPMYFSYCIVQQI